MDDLERRGERWDRPTHEAGRRIRRNRRHPAVRPASTARSRVYEPRSTHTRKMRVASGGGRRSPSGQRLGVVHLRRHRA